MTEKADYMNQLRLLVDSLSAQITAGLSPEEVEKALFLLASKSFTLGQDYEYTNLLTTNEAADYLGINARSLRAVIVVRCRRLGIGRQIPGKDPWLFRKDEVEALRPDHPGRPRKEV